MGSAPKKTETAAYRPDKWLLGSSRELGGSRVPADPGLAPGMQQARQAFMMLQNMSMLMNGGNTGTRGQGMLSSLILYASCKRRRTSNLQSGNETVAGQAAAAADTS